MLPIHGLLAVLAASLDYHFLADALRASMQYEYQAAALLPIPTFGDPPAQNSNIPYNEL